MDFLSDPSFGLEIVATGLISQIINGLESEQDVVDVRFAPLDQYLDDLRGKEYTPIELESVPVENFHLGNDPTLIDEGDGRVPLDKYPNVCVMAYQVSQGSDDDGDQFASYTNIAYVETMVKSSPTEGAEVCSKRIWRQADAINNIVMRDRTLGGSVYEFGDAPSCIVSEVFERPKRPDEGHGENWFWQSARIEFAVNKYAPFE